MTFSVILVRKITGEKKDGYQSSGSALCQIVQCSKDHRASMSDSTGLRNGVLKFMTAQVETFGTIYAF